MKSVSVILPTYNESENISKIIGYLSKILPNNYEVIVVDDNSPDGTWKIVKEICLKNKSVRLILRKKAKGIASAFRDGSRLASGSIIVCMDSNLTHSPEVVLKLLEKIRNNDVVIASRYVMGGKDERSFVRVITSRIINLFAYMLLGSIKDYTSAFAAVRRNVIKKINIADSRHAEYFIKFAYDAKCKGFRMTEVPYTQIGRTGGVTKTNLLKDGFSYVIFILKTKFSLT